MTTCLSVIRPPLKPFSKPMRKGEYYSHDLLEMAAYGILGLQRNAENDEKVLNLHNHLIWKSYERGKDDVTDAIMDEAERLAESEESSPFALR